MKSHTFRGKRYSIKKVPPSKLKHKVEKDEVCHGYINPPQAKGKSIYINQALQGLPELEVYIHEGLHACCWDLDEKAVQDSAEDLARFLWKLGYRKPE